MYDVIGDIHGHAQELEALLTRLGYQVSRGAWRYPGGGRRAIFAGDYIDRGPESPRVLGIIRRMVDAESAVAIMGNHEYNAILWHTTGVDGAPLRSHSQAHLRQHEKTLEAFGHGSAKDDMGTIGEAIRWMRTLPLYFENADIRVVHATWEQRLIDAIAQSPVALADDTFLHRSAVVETDEFSVIDTLLKGREIELPDGHSYLDKEGTRRYRTRVRWWLDPPAGSVSLREIAMPPVDEVLGGVRVDGSSLQLPGYDDPRPVFFGHYWFHGLPSPLSDRIACVDYSVATGGSLCAYRYDGDLPLRQDRYVCVPAM